MDIKYSLRCWQHSTSTPAQPVWDVYRHQMWLMFCSPCIIGYQHTETNVMKFSFILLRIKGLYMFEALLAHPQKALHKRHVVYCVCVMSVGSTWCSQLTYHARNIQNAICAAPPEDKQVMLETCRGPKFLINWIKSASRWFHYTDQMCSLQLDLSWYEQKPFANNSTIARFHTEVFRAFSSVVRQMSGYNSQKRGTSRTSQFFSFYCYVCSVLCILCTVCV
jgi:hypothetical protein